MFRLSDVGIPSAPGNESPDAEIHNFSRLGASAARRQADIGPMRSTARRLLSLPIRAIPRTALAALADSFGDIAQILENRLRAQAVDALEGFRMTLSSEAMRVSARFPGLGTHPEVAFALEELGPRRLEAAQRALDAGEERDYDALIGFLDISAEGLRYDIDQAGDEAEVADALLRALDSVHDYLLARRLVDASYRLAQSGGSGFVFQIGSLPRGRSRALALLTTGSAASAGRWQPSRRAQLVPRHFSHDEPKQPVNVA
jgi:hypothetical protein